MRVDLPGQEEAQLGEVHANPTQTLRKKSAVDGYKISFANPRNDMQFFITKMETQETSRVDTLGCCKEEEPSSVWLKSSNQKTFDLENKENLDSNRHLLLKQEPRGAKLAATAAV